jgi:hypothetical protein
MLTVFLLLTLSCSGSALKWAFVRRLPKGLTGSPKRETKHCTLTCLWRSLNPGSLNFRLLEGEHHHILVFVEDYIKVAPERIAPK